MAVLAELLPPERAELSGRALRALEEAHPGLPGELSELGAVLAEAAGSAYGPPSCSSRQARGHASSRRWRPPRRCLTGRRI
ncbi:MAG: hypothetical protein ACRDJ4_00165 [Actinomycetota bacterium]